MPQTLSSSKWKTAPTRWKLHVMGDKHLPIFTDRSHERNTFTHDDMLVIYTT